jgi:hypothetical protein
MLTKITTQHMGLNLTLDGLARVNYLVGVNGSGKTRFMKSIKNRLDLYMDQSNEGGETESSLVKFFAKHDGREYEVLEHGSIANNSLDLDLLMVQGEKRTPLELRSDFINHPLTKKLVQIFDPDADFDLDMKGNNKIKFKDKNKQDAQWMPLDDMAAGFQSLFKFWNNTFHNKFIQGPGTYLLSLDEVDRHLHPSLAKQLAKRLENFIDEIETLLAKNSPGLIGAKVQVFVTTHSPFTIRGALEHEDHKIFHIANGTLKRSFDRQEMIAFSGAPFENALADLGFRMQDIFYPETLICVEGPVDALYLHYWLEKFLDEKGLPNDTYIKGVHYDFFEFGGSLAAHLTLRSNIDADSSEVLIPQNIVNVFSLGKKVFMMVDNDSGDAFEKTKARLCEVFENQHGCIFYRNEKYRTIECLLTPTTKFSTNKNSKVGAAVMNLKEWRKRSTPLKAFNPEVYPLVEALHDFLLRASKPQTSN